jgi:gluconate 2-dehydrogenase gamma chain
MTDGSDVSARYSRRAMIETTLGALGLVALCGLPMARAAAAEARRDPALRYFSEAEAATVSALVAQIIPTDDTPGAHEMGCMNFIDHGLAGFLAPLAGAFRGGLADFESSCRAAHPGAAGFAALPAEQQLQWLHQVEHTPFFDSLQQLTVLGALTMPDYGGNRNGLGWQLIGFEGMHAYAPPFGFYDRDYPGFDVAGKAP